MNRRKTCALALFALIIPGGTAADTLTIAQPTPRSLAFARYIASVHRRDPFTESGPVAVVIEASLPRLGAESRLLAIREISNSERFEYKVLGSEGDAMVTQELIAPYLAEEREIENLPVSSMIMTPSNYKFRFLGEAGTAGSPAYVFRIVPKTKRAGLLRGELWLDSETGLAIVQAGHFVKTSSKAIHRIEMVRDTKLQNGSPYSRITHVAIETRRAGRGYLTITEFPSAAIDKLASAGLTLAVAPSEPGVQAKRIIVNHPE